MATFVRTHCSECGEQVVNDDKTKWYVHAATKFRGVKEAHRVPGVAVVKWDEAGQLVGVA